MINLGYWLVFYFYSCYAWFKINAERCAGGMVLAGGVRAFSFDCDDCVGAEADVLGQNEFFFNTISAEIRSSLCEKVVVFCGSSRQGYESDQKTSLIPGQSGSFFIALRKVSDYLARIFPIPVQLDQILLADLFPGNKMFWQEASPLDDGVSFSRAIDSAYTGPHAVEVDEYSKLGILYLQIHKLVGQYPGRSIVYDFYDDKGAVLNSLRDFFTKYPEMIPSNVILSLNQYKRPCRFTAGESIESSKVVGQIQGAGLFDANYKNTVREMAQISILQRIEVGKRIEVGMENCACDFATVVTPDLLTLRNLMPLSAIIVRSPMCGLDGFCISVKELDGYYGSVPLAQDLDKLSTGYSDEGGGRTPPPSDLSVTFFSVSDAVCNGANGAFVPLL